MPSREQDLLRHLDQQLLHAIETSQIEVYGQPSHLYHRGIYSNRTSVWSHSPTLMGHRNTGYLITATPKTALRLAILPTQAIVKLLDKQTASFEDVGSGLESLCAVLEQYCPTCGLDGFATLALEGGNHYRHVLLFRPLDALALYDIEPL